MFAPRCFEALRPRLEPDLSVSNVLDAAKCVTRATEVSAVSVTSCLPDFNDFVFAV